LFLFLLFVIIVVAAAAVVYLLTCLALATLAQSLGTNWGLSLGLEELDISGNDGESASAVWGQYAMSLLLLVGFGCVVWFFL
jgi:hypothetical protein